MLCNRTFDSILLRKRGLGVAQCAFFCLIVVAATGCGDDDNNVQRDASTDASVEDAASDAMTDGGDGSIEPPCDTGTTGCWVPLSTTDAPDARTNHTAVWTGANMVVWGGGSDSPKSGFFSSGGIYDPSADTWAPTASTLKVELFGRISHAMVWSGEDVLIWGGSNEEGDDQGPWQQGGRYDPVEDDWSLMTLKGVPVGRANFASVWTDALLVIWGGSSPTTSGWTASGGRYDPEEDTWQAITSDGVPSARSDHTAVWTGSEMIVWGGVDETTTISHDIQTGAAYDPVADEWTDTTTTDAPVGRRNHSAVWTGSEMIIWGGWTYADEALDDGGRYDPEADEWTAMSTTDAPSARARHTAVWTGSRMIVWGGQVLGTEEYLNSGAMYDPATDTWSPISMVNAPSARSGHTTVWTGSAMIVWGGTDENGVVATGAAFYPPR